MSEWIKCCDRLPEISHNELVCWNGRWSRVGHYLDSSKHGPGFFSPHDERLPGIIKWLPLPEHDE